MQRPLAPILLLAVPASLLVALPSVWLSPSAGFFSSAATSAALLGPAAIALTAERPRGLSFALVAILWSLLPLFALGALLQGATHHRPLGAVTFALLSAFALLGAVALAAAVGRKLPRAVDRWLPWLGALPALGCLLIGFPHVTALHGVLVMFALGALAIWLLPKLPRPRLGSAWLSVGVWVGWIVAGSVVGGL